MVKKEKGGVFFHFKYFYSQIGYGIFIGLFLSFLVGLLDGLGLAMFLPLLEMIDGSTNASGLEMNKFHFVVDFVNGLGFQLNLTTILVSILILFFLKGIISLIEGYYKIYLLQKFIVGIRKRCLEDFTKYSFKSFILADSGHVQNTLSTEISRVAGSYVSYFLGIQQAIFVLVYVSLALVTDFTFALLLGFGGLLTHYLFGIVNKKTKKHSESITEFGNKFQGQLIQIVANFKYLKSTGRLNDYSQKLNKSIDDIEYTTKKIGFTRVALLSLREPFVLSVIVIAIFIQVLYFDQKIGVIILSLLFFYRALNFLIVYQTQWNNFLGMSGALSNLNSFMSDLSQNEDKFGVKQFEKLEKGLELNNVDFSYAEGQKVLNQVNLKIVRNTTTAIVGESGSGKTTLVNIISGIIKIDEGNYSIDGIDSKVWDLRTFQNRIGYITQEPVMFDDDIYNNVTFWSKRNDENYARFWEALRKASIDQFVSDLPKKDYTRLGSNGIMVSGGQKQRLAIARELFRDIDVLIMDEATSALDSETEKVIQENIESLKGHYTILIVAHRLSTIKTSDSIVLMSDGKIEDQGSFNNLIERNPRFKNMVDLQVL